MPVKRKHQGPNREMAAAINTVVAHAVRYNKPQQWEKAEHDLLVLGKTLVPQILLPDEFGVCLMALNLEFLLPVLWRVIGQYAALDMSLFRNVKLAFARTICLYGSNSTRSSDP